MKPAIRVENLSKQYRIGTKARPGSHNLTESIMEGASALWRGLTNRARGGDGAEAFWALKDVSFEVQPGEVVGIIGRNGAGKSTLLKILSRIAEPTSGRAVVRGRMASLLEVGTGFHPELTGRENIYLNGSILGMSRQEINRKFDEIVAFSEIEKFLDTPVKRYSSGMYVRLAFAVAAHLEPELLIVDEVLAVGDIAFQKKCMGKMSEVGKHGRTVLFVSHNMPAIQSLCGKSLLLAQGRLVKVGPTSSVVSEYLGDATHSSDGCLDLRRHPARPCGYEPIITRMILRSEKGVSTTTFCPDESLVVEIMVEPRRMIRKPRIAVAIEDALGRRLFTCASYFVEGNLPDMDSPTKVYCRIPQLKLGTGRYLASVSIGTRAGLLDSLDNVAWFEIAWRNSILGGEPYNPVYGPVLMESSWSSDG